MESLNLLQKIVVYAIPTILAITIHEAAHGYVARYFGDRTAEMMGRLTLNPLKHIDPVGTILVPGSLLVLGFPFLFGWAKPVPVAARNLRRPHRDMAIVAAAGPVSNLAMAAGWTLILAIAMAFAGGSSLFYPLRLMAEWGVFFNVLLAIFNLFPLPPLDGGRVLSGLLSPRASASFDQLEPYGLFIIVGLLATGILWKIVGPVINLVAGLIFGLVS